MTPSCPSRRGFTLVELMISLGIALLLIYGINLVFRAVTDTVRVGNALSVATRKMRSVDSALTLDFEGTFVEFNPQTLASVQQGDLDRRWSGIVPVVGDIDPTVAANYGIEPRQPAITIFCQRQVQFLNKADRDANGTKPANQLDENENGNVTNFDDVTGYAATPPAAQVFRLGTRAHRLDTIGFYSGGSFAPHSVRPAQTSGGTYTNGPQAWVWYGHLLQYGDSTRTSASGPIGDPVVTAYADLKPYLPAGVAAGGKFFQPGDGDEYTNPSNFYASDWVLGRFALTVLPREGATTSYPGVPAFGQPPVTAFTGYFFGQSAGSQTVVDFTKAESQATGTSTNSTNTADSVPQDLNPVPNSVPFTSALDDVSAVWLGLPGAQSLLPTGAVNIPNDGTTKYDKGLFNGLVRSYSTAEGTATWWQNAMLQLPAAATPVPMRFDTVSAFTRPLQKSNQLGGNDKAALGATYLAKGCTQFVVEFAGDFYAQSGDGNALGNGPDGVLDFDLVKDATGAVVKDAAGNPLRRTRWYGLPRDVNGDGVADVLPVASAPGGTLQSFEKILPTAAKPNQYAVAFGPKEFYPDGKTVKDSVRPWLIRITVTLTDPNGNLPNGVSREFVYKVR